MDLIFHKSRLKEAKRELKECADEAVLYYGRTLAVRYRLKGYKPPEGWTYEEDLQRVEGHYASALKRLQKASEQLDRVEFEYKDFCAEEGYRF